MKKNTKIIFALLLALIMAFAMFAVAACKPDDPSTPTDPDGKPNGDGGDGKTPFVTAPFCGLLTSGAMEEDAEDFIIFQFLENSNVDGSGDILEEGYSMAMLVCGMEDQTLYAYTLNDNALTFYPLTMPEATVGAESCGTGTIDGNKLTFSVKYTLHGEDATEKTAQFEADMYKLNITGGEILEADIPIPETTFVGKDSLFAMLFISWTDAETQTFTFNGTVLSVDALTTAKMPAQESTLVIAAAAA